MLIPIPVLADNYVWLYQRQHCPALLIDMGDFAPVLTYLQKHHLAVEALLLTHAHTDHTAGVADFRRYFPHIPVFGAEKCGDIITHIAPSQGIHTSHYHIEIIATPGHSETDLSYFVDDHLFCGDTLFSLGCGRVFTGNYPQMFESLQKIKALPSHTQLCPAHEYTLDNFRFAQHVSHNLQEKQALEINYGIAKYLVKAGEATLPTSLATEKLFNPFLKANSVEDFKALRQRKDQF